VDYCSYSEIVVLGATFPFRVAQCCQIRQHVRIMPSVENAINHDSRELNVDITVQSFFYDS
jgi:hypothetical protein